MAKAKGTIIISGLNGVRNEINDTALNRIIVNGTYSYIRSTDQVVFSYKEYKGTIGRQGVNIQRPHNSDTKSNSSSCVRGRQLRITSEDTLINLSRLFMLCKAISLNQIAITDIDNYVLNHLDNKGDLEAVEKSNAPLDVDNYELVTQRENTCHGKKWHKVKEQFGIETKFSALDKTFMDIIDMSETKKQFLGHIKIQGLDLEKYNIKLEDR